jgi:CheY-like chemotaxis protein
MQYDSELITAEPEIPDIIPGEGLILIVDDEKAIRITAGKMLESLGYQVLTAENGEEGLEVFRVHREEISAVLLDVAMPQMAGDEAYTRMKEIDPNLKVLLSSGFTSDLRVRKTLEAGADGFIKKPYSIAKLSRKIHDVLKS